jgi:cell division protein FtsN
MLPFLLASVFGIIISGFNIFFANNSKIYAVGKGLSIRSQNMNVRASAADVNSVLTGAAAGQQSQQGNIRPASGNLISPKNQIAAKTEAQKTNNVRVTVPVEDNKSQRSEVNKTETSINASSNIKTQNWLIQAGAFSIESSAVNIKNKIVSLGYNVEIVKTGTAKPLFKVMVSAGNSKDVPNDALKKLNSIGVEGYIVGGRS